MNDNKNNDDDLRPAGAATNPVKKGPHSEKDHLRAVLTAERSRLSALVALSSPESIFCPSRSAYPESPGFAEAVPNL